MPFSKTITGGPYKIFLLENKAFDKDIKPVKNGDKATYTVVEKVYNSWTGEIISNIIFESDNLLAAYYYLQDKEELLKAISYHDGGSPLNKSYQIDTYLNRGE